LRQLDGVGGIVDPVGVIDDGVVVFQRLDDDQLLPCAGSDGVASIEDNAAERRLLSCIATGLLAGAELQRDGAMVYFRNNAEAEFRFGLAEPALSQCESAVWHSHS